MNDKKKGQAAEKVMLNHLTTQEITKPKPAQNIHTHQTKQKHKQKITSDIYLFTLASWVQSQKR